jgi:hypothetical protein
MNNNIRGIVLEEVGYFFEALRDDIPDYMRNIIKKRHGEKYLNMDTPKHTDIIPNVKIEIKDKNVTQLTTKMIVDYFRKSITDEFEKSKVVRLLNNTIFSNFLMDSIGNNFSGVNLNNPDSFKILYSKNFRLPIVSKGDVGFENISFSNNRSNIFGLYKYFLKILQLSRKNLYNIPTYEELTTDKIFSGLREPIINYDKNVGELYNSKLYLYISDKPDDKLRMSVSNFYSSCQNIYTGGDEGTVHNKRLLSNVFDENSKVCYLIFDSPFKDNKGNEHPYTPIARTIIRQSDGVIMFDKVYPLDMKDILYQLIENNTELRNQGQSGDKYKFKKVQGLPVPYMDTYTLKNVGNREDEVGERIEALAYHLGVEIKEIVEEGETIFSVDGEEWVVYTEDEANEQARDYLMDSFMEYFSGTDISTITSYGIITADDIGDVVGFSEERDDDDKEGYDMDLEEFLDMQGITTLDDLVKGAGMDWRAAYRWAERVVDYDSVVDYWGGESEIRSTMLAHYDGAEHDAMGYLLYRRN